jgi:hypothetical protein
MFSKTVVLTSHIACTDLLITCYCNKYCHISVYVKQLHGKCTILNKLTFQVLCICATRELSEVFGSCSA